MNTNKKTITYSGSYDVTIREDGHSRATVMTGAQKGMRYIKVDGFVFGKRSAADRITEDHAVLEVVDGVGRPFQATDEETCAEAMVRFHREREERSLNRAN